MKSAKTELISVKSCWSKRRKIIFQRLSRISVTSQYEVTTEHSNDVAATSPEGNNNRNNNWLFRKARIIPKMILKNHEKYENTRGRRDLSIIFSLILCTTWLFRIISSTSINHNEIRVFASYRKEFENAVLLQPFPWKEFLGLSWDFRC